ncbi:hypothetical protein ABIB40_002193 [Pedobacter sp. UYP30]|uniref:basic secretory protein-like protein n=1 Tax=Pedobacter sp. UYP30 TaxID=1756400 RepID=UPI003391E425
MMNRILILISVLLFSISASAQTDSVKRNRYTLVFENPSSLTNPKVKDKVVDAFFKAYPAFARADGYRTKRKVSLTIKPSLEKVLAAKEGEILVDSAWINGNPKNIDKILEASLSSHWQLSDTTKHHGYTLVFVSKDPNLDPEVKKTLTETYFAVYPKLRKTFNKKARKDVLFVIDTAYKAVAEASDGRILFSAAYMKAHPTDIDIVTHEGMHVVQVYDYGSGPVWLTEGIADYVRYKYGYDNVGSKWYLPAYNAKQSYTNSYRVTARFFVWLEQNVKPEIIKTIDGLLRKKQYTLDSWKSLTGKTLDELWAEYGKKPNKIHLEYSDRKTGKMVVK